jgi:hypothetical protein
MADKSGKRDFILGTAAALVLSVLLSWGAVYGRNRYLGPVEEPIWTMGGVRR